MNRYKLFLFIPLFLAITSVFAQNTAFDSLMVLEKQEIYFDFGQHDLRPEADSFLTQVALVCAGKANIKVKITAHTDAIGSNVANQSLSLRRGDAVKQALIAKGIAAEKIGATVFGEEDPIASNDTEAGRQRNRRATVEVMELIPMVYLSGQIKDQETGLGIQADVIVRTKETRDSIRTDSAGYFKSAVPDGAVVGIDVYAKGYFFETQMTKVSRGKNFAPIEIPLPIIKVGEKVAIKNLYFVGDQAVLLERSLPELPKILKFMQLNDRTAIEIGGHVNVPNKAPGFASDDEVDLSLRRAQLVYDYLIENKISPDRLQFKGYGNAQMKYPTATSLKHQEMNRRVEIKIIKN